MKLSADTIERLVMSVRDPKELAKAIVKAEEIAATMQAIDRESDDLQRKTYAALNDLQKRRAAVQSKCPHNATKHYSDPAGGSDSGDTCLVCGKDV